MAVTRRYYRSGESEYYINRQSVRLKDVTELFMDTGMGKEGYSIIGQGKIDEILSAKSGERREIFEEAAGIAKFRHRKEDAERKLERTEENLVRINDKIAELEMQVDPLRDQAEKAKKVSDPPGRAAGAGDLPLAGEPGRPESRPAEAGDRLPRRRSGAGSGPRGPGRPLRRGRAVRRRMQEKDMEAERLRTEASELENKAKEQEGAVAVLESTIAHNQETIQRASSEMTESDTRAGSLAAQATEQKERAAELEGQIREENEALEALMKKARSAAERADGRQSEAEALRGQEAMAAAAAADARAEAAAAAAEKNQIQERSAAAESDRAAAQERLTQTQQESRENRHRLEDARDEAAAAANVIAGHSLRMEERAEKMLPLPGRRRSS